MSSVAQSKNLFEAIRIGDMTLKNRITMAEMTTRFASEDGYVTDRLRNYYEARAKGGVALIGVEPACIDCPTGLLDTGLLESCELAIDDDRFIPGLSELSDVIKKHNCKCSLMLHHAGPRAVSDYTHIQPVGPSPVKSLGETIPKELTISEIDDIVAKYAKAAERTRRAGFDAVQIQFAGGYLLGSFLSSITNKRQDIYGGELKNRARIHLQILAAVREAVGPNYPILCRINGKEYGEEYGIEGCLTIEESKEFARMLENAGVSAISVYCWGFIQKAYGLAYDYTKVFPDEPGMLVPVGHEIKKVVSIPVEIAGRLSPELGERILEEGKADLIGFGRQFFADPGFPNKIASGRQEDIVPCITCLNCVESHRLGQPLTCSVNPELGKEREYVISPTDRKKKVVVVGGGPAGMEAACVAARRGHEVVLYEESNELGGQLLLAALPPRKEVIGQLTKYLVTQVRKLGVRLELGKQATPKLIEEEKPDAVIIATGILPFTPAILGSDRNNVVRFDEVLTDKVEVEEKVVIIGGGIVGCETAEHLADKGKKVAVVEMLDRIAAAMLRTRRWQLLERLNSKGVTLLSGVICQEITEKGCVVINKEGRKETIQADTIVLATGGNPNGQLFQALKGKVSEIYRVGDCVEFRSILEAIAESYSLARKI